MTPTTMGRPLALDVPLSPEQEERLAELVDAPAGADGVVAVEILVDVGASKESGERLTKLGHARAAAHHLHLGDVGRRHTRA